ncbi:MAG: helix-turn-helix domain-containing protein [Flavobacteriaceae bacterium]|jgi:transcriptional regulator with XRE-family HTH domain|nr:helix-turn-helix domain-containing protein [Flavobacteriaceae bacterium]
MQGFELEIKIQGFYNYIKIKKIRNKDIVEKTGLKKSNISNYMNGKLEPSENFINDFEKCYNVNLDDFADSEMLKENPPEKNESVGDVQFYYPENTPAGRRLIPLYDSSSTVGSNPKSGIVAETEADNYVSEWIDPGDWFKNATAAIRHYEDSMIEYPSGCILALKEVKERQLIIWGSDYVIETNEYRITKRVQRGNDEKHIRAYSSNTETYPDGRLVHEPLDIDWNDVGRIFLVLGYVIKKGSGTMVYPVNKK